MRVGSVAKAVAIGVRWRYGIVDCDKRANGNGWDKRWSSRIPSGSNTKRTETSGKKVLFFGKRAAEVDIFAKIGYNTQKKGTCLFRRNLITPKKILQ